LSDPVERPTGRALNGERAKFLSVQALLDIESQHTVAKVDPSNGNPCRGGEYRCQAPPMCHERVTPVSWPAFGV
jgi:hypothetical protein